MAELAAARLARHWLAGTLVLLAGCTTTERRVPLLDYHVETQVEGSAPLQPPRAANPAVAGPIVVPAALQDPEAASPQQQESEAARLHTRFGSSILIRPDGRVTKDYFLSKESGDVLMSLLREPGQPAPPPNQTHVLKADSRSVLSRMVGARELEFLYMDKFEAPEGVPIRAPVDLTTLKPSASTDSNSLLLVTAAPDALDAFERAMDQFFNNIPQIEIEVKVVEFSTNDSLSTGIDQLRDANGVPTDPTLGHPPSSRLIKEIVSRFPLSPPPGAGSGAEVGEITLGGMRDSWALNAHLQFLETHGIADIVSNPKMVVRNGGLASVTTTTDFPFPQAKISSSGQNITQNIAFKPVGVQLNIRPVIAGSETVILQIYASISAVTSFAATTPVPTPVISTREVVTSVHVANGKTTVIGGLVTKSIFESESKFPILGDIPVLGLLFRSTVDQTTETLLQFHITPRIIQGPRGFHGDSLGG